ncbi:SapC [Marinomonas aquimarina]|uniref:SapC n=1 Tax=Marinomonas aquimarina TaxID=295068 RepID=A0A1A8T3Z1_9GAMM|nr:SapC family protein [Marinomonas aquimarina]SBS25801.1 SapC [Marinomonas aquimarina]
MPNWQALSKEKHAKAGWVSPTGYPQAKTDAIAPLLVAELSHALAYYPIVLAPVENGGFRLNVLLSLESGSNLFVNYQDKWMVPYVPAVYRSYPFNMMLSEEGKHVLAVDVESAFFHEQAESSDQAVLDDEGQPGESLKPMIGFMQQRLLQQQQTDALVLQLVEKGLVEEWPIQLKVGPAEEDVRKLGGLFRINERKLQELPESDISALAKSGALSIAYAQLFSQARLKEMQARFIQFKQQTQTAAPVEQVDLDKLFDGESDSDVFSF